MYSNVGIDQAEILCHSILMLNVDTHNPVVKSKISLHKYTLVTRGPHEVPEEDIKEIYESVRKYQIKVYNAKSLEGVLHCPWGSLMGLMGAKTRFWCVVKNGIFEVWKSSRNSLKQKELEAHINLQEGECYLQKDSVKGEFSIIRNGAVWMKFVVSVPSLFEPWTTAIDWNILEKQLKLDDLEM